MVKREVQGIAKRVISGSCFQGVYSPAFLACHMGGGWQSLLQPVEQAPVVGESP